MKAYEAYNDKLFSRWAPIYDGFELILSRVRKQIAEEIQPTNQKVLDVATGTGSLAIALSQHAKEVIGIDLSISMLEVARKKKHPNNLSFVQMDASKLSFPNQSFDCITISLGLHDMPLDIRNLVLEEAKRVLKDDGNLYILEYDLAQDKLLKRISSRMINLFESKYFLPFVQGDLENYLSEFGFKLDKKTSYLVGHLQLLSVRKR